MEINFTWVIRAVYEVSIRFYKSQKAMLSSQCSKGTEKKENARYEGSVQIFATDNVRTCHQVSPTTTVTINGVAAIL